MKAKLFLGKKAGLYFVMFQILLVVLTAAFLTYYLNAEMEDTGSARLSTSRNLAIKTSAAYSAPGNYDEIHMLPPGSSLFTSQGIHSFDFDFQNNLIDISGKRFPYASNPHFSISTPLIKNKTAIQLTNYGYDFTISDLKKTYNQDKKLKYPLITTLDINWKTKPIIIPPTSEQSEKFYSFYKNQLNLNQIIVPNAIIYLEINFDNSSNIVAEIQSDKALKSRKLSSILINNIIDNLNKEIKIEKAYISVIDENINSQSVVKLTIGNKLNLKIPELNQIIFKSMEDYFKNGN